MTRQSRTQPQNRLSSTTSTAADRTGVGISLVLSLLLSACTSYQPHNLPDTPNLAIDPTVVNVDPATLPLQKLKNHPLDLADGLDEWEIAMLAVSNNPTLKATRFQQGVAQAQVYLAGLLPDPQLSVDLAHPTGGGAGRVNGFNLGLAYDIESLITHEANQAASIAAQNQVNLQVLWQEWQVAQQARLLTVQVESTAQKLALLEEAHTRNGDRYHRVRQLLARGDLTLDTAAAVTTAWFETFSRLNQERQAHSKQQHELNALLGLAPEVNLPLAPTASPTTSLPGISDETWSTLPQRRPDLRALQAGYQSQEQRVHKAILAQFPALNIGFSRDRDTDGLYTTGFGITINLPMFSGNRGQIAIERATREQLRAEYQARLDQTRSDISRLLARLQIMLQQDSSLQQHLPELESLVMTARRAYQNGDLAALDLLNLENTWLDKRLELIELKQALSQVRIALDTLLAWPTESE